jgi:hypothetical protein
MKIIKNVLSEDLYRDIISEFKSFVHIPVWTSSILNWEGGLKVGLHGSCLSSVIPDKTKKRLEKEISAHLPEYDELLCQYYIWQQFSGISWHDDTNHKFGATIYLNQEWHPNYGGLFIWFDNESNIDDVHHVICPSKNTMIVNDNNEYHMVTPVNTVIPDMRCTIQIWGD